MYDAIELLQSAVQKNKIHLSVLVAETSLWASPRVHDFLRSENGCGAWRPNVRRAKSGEARGSVIDGVRLDDNTYANTYLKTALGVNRKDVIGFATCHIWPGTCYDERYHTTIANLILIPRALAGLSDHDEEVISAIQYRSFELYGWYPEGDSEPTRPYFYPSNWREPLLFTDRILKSLRSRK